MKLCYISQDVGPRGMRYPLFRDLEMIGVVFGWTGSLAPREANPARSGVRVFFWLG